ncbi:hypothetical protein BDZ97DRAFT_1927001 [Flammula alnicola]|nr:hypothetical protein BDZ97DRAFT_1927001 [Flammula alnicola]
MVAVSPLAIVTYVFASLLLHIVEASPLGTFVPRALNSDNGHGKGVSLWVIKLIVIGSSASPSCPRIYRVFIASPAVVLFLCALVAFYLYRKCNLRARSQSTPLFISPSPIYSMPVSSVVFPAGRRFGRVSRHVSSASSRSALTASSEGAVGMSNIPRRPSTAHVKTKVTAPTAGARPPFNHRTSL